jgi:polysaccharide pyruvyl transferase
VAGWFSFEGLGATAGDLLARDVACGWLSEAGYPYDVAVATPFTGGCDWRHMEPARYSHLVFVCGPFWVRRTVVRILPGAVATAVARRAAALRRVGLDPFRHFALELLVSRFRGARLVGLGISVLGPPGAWQPFHLLLERDSAATARPDLSFASAPNPVPVVGVILADRAVRADARRAAEAAERAVSRLLASREAARLDIDTRLDRPNRGGLRTPAEVESLIARTDAVVTTRLHGAVLALRSGVPAVIIDPVAGGGKVWAQAQAIGWPLAYRVDALDGAVLSEALTFCLTADARRLARDCARRAGEEAEELKKHFLAGLE